MVYKAAVAQQCHTYINGLYMASKWEGGKKGMLKSKEQKEPSMAATESQQTKASVSNKIQKQEEMKMTIFPYRTLTRKW